MKPYPLVVLLLWSPQIHAEDTALVKQANQVGATPCATHIGNLVKFVHPRDNYAHMATWNKADPAKRMFQGLTSEAYTDGRQLVNVAVTPNAAGSCDLSFTQIFVYQASCTEARETTFKEWKYYADISGVALYEDPTSPSVNVAFISSGPTCVVVKTGAMYY